MSLLGYQAVAPLPLRLLRAVEALDRRGAEVGLGPGPSDRRLLARGGGLLFLTAGLIGMAALTLPGGAGDSLATAVGTSVASLLLGFLLLVWGWRFSLVIYQLLALSSTTLSSLSAYYGGQEGWLNGFYYFWIALFAAYFFSARWITIQLLVIGGEYGLVVGLERWRHGALIWFLTVATVSVMTTLVAYLRRRLEHALVIERSQVDHLRELDRLRSGFMATVSHELRTPVSAVYGALATLHRQSLAPLQRDELLTVAHQEAQRLAELTDDILQSTAIERQELSLELEPVDPLVVAKEAIAPFNGDGQRVDLLAPTKMPAVTADSEQLKRVLMSLLDNAVQYSPPDQPVVLELVAGDWHVRLVVRDRGPGIPAEMSEQVFEKFHRLDPNMTSGLGGSGLGLFIVRGLVDAMDGRVWIEPGEAGVGTALIVELNKWGSGRA